MFVCVPFTLALYTKQRSYFLSYLEQSYKKQVLLISIGFIYYPQQDLTANDREFQS